MLSLDMLQGNVIGYFGYSSKNYLNDAISFIGMIIKKKVLKKYFEKIASGEKNWEFRLADFEIAKGDILELIELDDATRRPTGRKLSKTVVNVTRFNPTDFYTLEDIKKTGVQIISF